MTIPLDPVALLPCPFCGRNDLKVIPLYSEDDPKHIYAYTVMCRSCHAHGMNNFPICWAETEQMARDGWNTRALTSLPLPDEVAALVKNLEDQAHFGPGEYACDRFREAAALITRQAQEIAALKMERS